MTICEGESFSLGVQGGMLNNISIEYPNGVRDNSPDGNSYFSFLNSVQSSTGIYTIFYEDAKGCNAFKEYNVLVEACRSNTGSDGDDCLENPSSDCPCNLNATVSNQTYLDSNTTNTAEHTFNYDLTIDGSGSRGWILYDIVDGNLNQIINTGARDTILNMSPFPVDQDGSLLILMDANNTACIQNISVNMSSCVYTGDCDCCR